MNKFLNITLSVILLLCAACSPKADTNAEYREQSSEETSQATKETFTESPVSDASHPAVDALFTRFSQASRSEAPIEVEAFLSVDAMIQSMESADMLGEMNFMQRMQFKKGLTKGLQNFGITMKQMAFDEFRIMRVETLDSDEKLAYIRHYDNVYNTTSQMRWWLIDSDEGLRIYDFEELSIGLRTMTLMGLLFKEGINATPEAWVQDLLSVVKTVQSVNIASEEGLLSLEQPLLKLRKNKLPKDIRRFASILHVAVLQVKGEYAASLNELEAAKSGGYDGPIYHYLKGSTLMAQEAHAEAITEFEAHAALLGWDSDVLELLSDSYWQLGKREEARDAALRGLEDNPNSINCLASLSIASTDAELLSPETAALFAACADPEFGYEVALDFLLDSDKEEKAKTLFTVFKNAHPDSELISYYESELL